MAPMVNGAHMAFWARGGPPAPAVLLIHGFPLDHRLWVAQLRGLAPLAWVIAPDLRGHGRSASSAGYRSMEQHADDLVALLDHLRIRRAVVAGLSMGGYIAFAMWRRHPLRIRALALIGTRAESDGPAACAARDVAAIRVRDLGAAAYAEEMLPRLLAPASLANPRVAGRARRIMADQSVSGILADLSGLRDRLDSGTTLPTITVPTLVLVGEADALTPPVEAQAMASAIPCASLAVVPRAGHLSPLENPRAVNALLRGFVGGLPAGDETTG